MFRLWSDFDRNFTLFDDLRRRMDRVFDDYGYALSSDAFFGRSPGAPHAELRDEGHALVLEAAVPGLDEKELQLDLDRNVLTLRAERKVDAPAGYKAHRRERGSFAYGQSYALPAPVDPEKTKAVLKNGILTVTLEKAPEARPRQITVQAS